MRYKKYSRVLKMKYRITIENEIHKEITKQGKIRWRKLRNIIVNEKNITSDRIFRETLNNMVEKKRVFKIEIAKQNVVYTTDSEFLDEEKNTIEAVELLLPDYEENFKEFKKRLQKSSDYEKASIIIILMRMLSQIDWMLQVHSHNLKTKAVKNNEKRLNDYKNDLVSWINEYSINNSKVRYLVSNLIKSEFSRTSKDFIDWKVSDLF